jgi:hypothetical protein
MTDEGRLFLEACGASGPLRFEWIDPTSGEVRGAEVGKPAFIVGADPSADIMLDDSSLQPFQAFFQVVDGRLFAFDLVSSGGLKWGDVPRSAGWVNRGQPLKIGRYVFRLVDGDREGGESIVEPAPTSSRYVSRLPLPPVALEYRVTSDSKHTDRQREFIDRVLVLCGRTDRCRIRLDVQQALKFATTLIRTPTGMWMANVLPSEGAMVNGAFCRFARLEDEDKLQLGNLRVRVVYSPTTTSTSIVRSSSNPLPVSLGLPNQPAPLAGPVNLAELLPELPLQPFLEQTGASQGLTSSPFGQALVLLMHLLGNVHRDHLTLVRDELAQIRRLSVEMDKLRGKTQQPERPHVPLRPASPSNGTGHAADLKSQPEAMPSRPSPEAVQEIVSERLEAWERERQSRWRKLLKLLTSS